MTSKRIGLGVLACALIAGVALAQQGLTNIKEVLTGYEEVPSVSTTASGQFDARIRKDDAIEWELSYSDLEGSVLQSHIHFAQTSVNGAIAVFLCTNLGNGPAGTQPCPAPPATIHGIILPSSVTAGAAGQGIEAGAFEELLAAMRAGKTYVNLHSTKWPGGEIRSQIDNGTP